MTSNNQALAVSTPFALLDTKVSGPDPIPGHQMHDAVVILPPRNDTKIYSGTLTFSMHETVPEEYQRCMAGMKSNLKETPQIAETVTDPRVKLQARAIT